MTARTLTIALASLFAFAGCDAFTEEAPSSKVVRNGDPVRGREIIASGIHGCNACHTIPGVRAARGVVGPPLDDLARRAFIAGQLPNRPAILIEFVLDPPALVPETAMPNVGLSPAEARHVAAYLYTLERRDAE